MNRRPPRLATALLGLFVPREERESIPGDLEEEFATTNRSNLWFWWQVMECSGHLGWRTLGRSGLGVVAGGLVMATALALIQASVRTALPGLPRRQPVEFLFTLAILGLGLWSAALAGYVSSAFARGAGIPTCAALGLLLLALDGYWLFGGPGSTAPMWFRGAFLIFVLPAVIFGGRLGPGHKG
jgi:hypothetical protein